MPLLRATLDTMGRRPDPDVEPEARGVLVEPVPETEAALQLLGTEDSYLADDMRRAGTDLTAAAPTAIGFSLGVFADGITLTFVSSRPSLRLLDAVQYLDGGPCEDALSEGRPLELGREDPLDEQPWELFCGRER